MTEHTMVLPYYRVSPIHIPRRDIALTASDCLMLHVSVVEADDPSAMSLELTGGLGGPALRLFIFSDRCGNYDYGAPRAPPSSVLWAGTGTISTTAPGTFDLDINSGAFANFPQRCGWSIQLDWNGGGHSDVLAHGVMNCSRSVQLLQPPIFVTPDTDDVFVTV